LGQELDVVDDQRLDAAELPPEALHAPRLERGDHLVHEVLRGEAHHRAERARVGEAGRHRREQVGLAEPAAAAEEERVEAGTGLRRASEDPPRNAPQAGEKSPNSPTRAFTRLRPPPETPHRPTAASSCARRPRPTTLHLIASFE